jgi:hypothetical protein
LLLFLSDEPQANKLTPPEGRIVKWDHFTYPVFNKNRQKKAEKTTFLPVFVKDGLGQLPRRLSEDDNILKYQDKFFEALI